MYIYRLVSVLILGVYLLSPTLIDSWGDANTAWYQPFVFWFLLIALAAWFEIKRGNDEF